jgi:hypothetical protein
MSAHAQDASLLYALSSSCCVLGAGASKRRLSAVASAPSVGPGPVRSEEDVHALRAVNASVHIVRQ